MGPVQPAVMCQQKLRVQVAQRRVGEKAPAASARTCLQLSLCTC